MISKKKEKILKEMPIIRSEIRKSKDGKYIIHRTVITNIKPREYYEAVLADTEELKTIEDTDLRDFLTAVEDL